jgi:CBS domain containing-hemolysin-like protein
MAGAPARRGPGVTIAASDVWLLLLAVVLVVGAALLAAADAAFSRVSRVAVEAAVREGKRGAEPLRLVVADPARYVNVVLFLQVLCEVGATVAVASVLRDAFSEQWIGLLTAIGVMVVVTYVLVGVAPRTLGRQHAERVARAAAGPVRALARVLSPLTRLLILVGNAVTPGRGFRDGPFSSEAELRDLVDLAEESDLIEDDERQMIHSVFELGDTFVREVMVPRPDMVFVERHKTLRQAMSLALRSGFSRIPVIGEGLDDVIGVVYLKDLVRRVYEHRDAETAERVETIMRPAVFVPDSKPADELLREMQAQRTHVAIVVDEYGGTAGLVTIEDVLEEIVGEISDEYDTGSPEVEPLADGAYRVSARLSVWDFLDLVRVRLDDEEIEDVDTVGGLMAKRLGKVPIAGSSVDLEGWRLVAESLEGRRNRVGSVLARPIAAPAEGRATEEPAVVASKEASNG